MRDQIKNLTDLTATHKPGNSANHSRQANFNSTGEKDWFNNGENFQILSSMIFKCSVGQFRHADDSSDNLRHPTRGFLSAIKCESADSAVAWFESTLPTRYVHDGDVMGLHVDLQITAQDLAQNHPNASVREFAGCAEDCLNENPYNVLAQLQTGEKIGGALQELKNSLENAKTQLRRNDDTSKSIFSPSANLVDVYDISAVQEALAVLKDSLPSDYMTGAHVLTREQSLIFQGWNLANEQPESQVKDFALAIVNYMWAHVPESLRLRPNPLAKLITDDKLEAEEDVLEILEDSISESTGAEKIMQYASAVLTLCSDETAITLALSILAHFEVDAMEESGELTALLTHNSTTDSMH